MEIRLKRFLSLALAILMVFSMMPQITIGASAASTKTIYLNAGGSSLWDQAGAWFAAWVWGSSSSDDAWYTFESAEEAGIYKIEIPADSTGMKINRMASGATAPSWTQGNSGYWNQTGDLTISSDKNLVTITGWNSTSYTWGTYTPPAVPVEYTWTVAGSAALCGSEWDPADTANDMTKQSDGSYTKVYENVAKGTYEFKVVRDHAWGTEYPSSNYSLTVSYAKATVTVTLNGTTVTAKADCAHGDADLTTDEKAATCTEDGYKKVTCACGETVSSETVAAPGHNFVDGTCSACGAADPDYVAPHEHDWSNKNGVCADTACGYECLHENQTTETVEATCTVDGSVTVTCDVCGKVTTSEVIPAAHKYEDGVCTVCEDGKLLSIVEANELGTAQDTNAYTTIKYCVEGVIESVYNTKYGNMYIKDADGNVLTVYGTYSADGSARYDAMEVKPVEGDTVKVYGIIGNYNGKAQMKNGWIREHTLAPCKHTEHNTAGECVECGVEVGHTFENNTCAACGASDILTIAEAIALGTPRTSNNFTPNQYYVTGVITEVYNEQYGNMYIADADGNTLTLYGTYSADGSTRYDAMEVKPVAGDTITIYGAVGNYNGKPQIKNGWIVEHIPEVEEPAYTVDSDDVLATVVVAMTANGDGWTCEFTEVELAVGTYPIGIRNENSDDPKAWIAQCDLVIETAGTYNVTVNFDGTNASVTSELIAASVTYVAYIGETGYETVAAAFAAAVAGDEVVINEAGTYALAVSGKNITVTGAVAGVEFTGIGAYNMGGASVTFNNVTFTYGNENYKGLQHAGNLVYNNCTINGQVFLYGASETFNGCTFNQTSKDAYNVWTYGAKEVTFSGCTFNSAGKSVLIYSEQADLVNDVTVTDCDFIASQTVDGKAAIEMDSSLTSGINLTIDDQTTATGFSTNTVSGSALWNNKKGSEGVNNDITVTVAGEVVLEPTVPISGTIGGGYVTKKSDGSRVYIVSDIANLYATESVVVKLFSGETLMATTTLQNQNYFEMTTLTVNIVISGSQSSSWSTVWEEGHPIANVVPDKVVLYVDGTEMNSAKVTVQNIDGGSPYTDWATVPGVNPVAPTITLDNAAILQQEEAARITMDVSISTDAEAMKFELYDTNGNLLTTVTPAKDTLLAAGEKTVSFMIKGDSSSWDQTEWVPTAEQLPDYIKATFTVNGVEYVAETDVRCDAISGGRVSLTQEFWEEILDKYYPTTNVAQIGETGYESLAAAVAAAANGDVITVVADHELTWNGETNIDGLPVLVAVDGKSVTIDLNGKKITGTSGASNLTYYAAFAVDNDGSLTLKDSVGGGSVSITGASTMYSLLMAYEQGANNATKLIVEGGSYYLETAHDSLIFAGDRTEMVYIKGGNFKLGNVGVGENGKPWIFNVVGAGDCHATISGGTFNADINHQFWSNEAIVVETCYTVDNGDGTWTVKEGAVAYVNEGMLTGPYFVRKNVGYATLEEAIAAADDNETVTLLTDITLTESVTVEKAITLEGNGKTITGEDDLILIKADLTLNGVTLAPDKYSYALNIRANDCEVVLNDCSITGPIKSYGTSQYTIMSGTYTKGDSYFSKMLNGAVVYGGTFDYVVDAQYCAPGYVCVDNGDGTWTVKYDPACFIDADNDGIIDEGETVYGSMDALFAADLSGEVTVVLLKNVETSAKVDTAADTTYNFVTYVDGGVTMDWNYGDNWNYIQKASIGENITLNVPYLCVWTDLDVYGNINTDYLYLNGGETTIHEGAVVNANTGDATTQVKNGTVLTVNGTLNTSTLNVWAGASKLVVSGANAKVDAAWIDIWDGTPSVVVENGATLEVDAIKASRGGAIAIDGATLKTDSLELGHNGGSEAKLTITNNGIIDGETKLTAPGSTVEGPEGLNVTTTVADHKVVYEDGVYKVVAKVYVAQISDTQKYESLAEAIANATAGDTITLLADITEDVTVSKSITIDGAGKNYTGNISVSGSTTAATVKNVNFVGGTGYAITTNRINSITVEGCTATGYGYGFLYANKSTPTVVVKDVVVSDVNYGFHWVYGTTATLENVKMTNVAYGIMVQSYGAKTVTLTNCEISGTNPIHVWERNATTQTFNFVGANTLTDTDAETAISTYAKLVLTEETATLAAVEGLDVTTTVADHKVIYEEGVYSVVHISYGMVAQIGNTYYETLAEAIEAAKAGETIVIVNDAEESSVVLLKGNDLDLAGHVVTVSSHVAAFAGNNIIDTVGGGLLKISNNVLIQKGNTYLPIWDATNGGYAFADLDNYKYEVKTDVANTTKYRFLPYMDAAEWQLIAQGAEASGVTLKVKASWISANGLEASATFVFSDDLVKQFVEYYVSGNRKVFTLTMTGTDSVESLTFEAFFESETGVILNCN